MSVLVGQTLQITAAVNMGHRNPDSNQHISKMSPDDDLSQRS